MKKRTLLRVFSIATLGMFLTACSNKNEETAAPKDASTFTYAISGDPSSMNPINTSDRFGLTATNMMYSPLVSVNTKGEAKNVLAESVEPAADGLSVTVKLKQDVKWSDGEPLTADDVVFTYNQKVKKENGNADNLWVDGKPIKTEKVDDYTVRFELPSVSAAALNTVPTLTFIIPEHIFKDEADFSGSELKATPVGTGPYKLVDYKRGEYLRFEANENYFEGKPEVEKVTLRIIENADTAKVALQKGEVDAAVVLPNDVQDLDDSKISIYPYSENRVGYMGLNTHSPELQDVRVRQAVLFALNKEELNQAAYLDKKFYTMPNSFLPNANPFATEKVEAYATNVEKSKELLKEAGVSNLKLNLAFTATDPVQSVQATLMQQQLQQAGITLELAGGDGSAISAEIKKPGSTKYNLFMGGYIMGNDPDQYKGLFTTDGSSNYFQTKNKETDALFVKGAQELDPEKRRQTYDELQRAIAEDARIYPIVDNKRVFAANKRISGVEEAGLVPIYTFDDMSKLKIK